MYYLLTTARFSSLGFVGIETTFNLSTPKVMTDHEKSGIYLDWPNLRTLPSKVSWTCDETHLLFFPWSSFHHQPRTTYTYKPPKFSPRFYLGNFPSHPRSSAANLLRWHRNCARNTVLSSRLWRPCGRIQEMQMLSTSPGQIEKNWQWWWTMPMFSSRLWMYNFVHIYIYAYIPTCCWFILDVGRYTYAYNFQDFSLPEPRLVDGMDTASSLVGRCPTLLPHTAEVARGSPSPRCAFTAAPRSNCHDKKRPEKMVDSGQNDFTNLGFVYWNKEISPLLFTTIWGENSCEVALIWPGGWKLMTHHFFGKKARKKGVMVAHCLFKQQNMDILDFLRRVCHC